MLVINFVLVSIDLIENDKKREINCKSTVKHLAAGFELINSIIYFAIDEQGTERVQHKQNILFAGIDFKFIAQFLLCNFSLFLEFFIFVCRCSVRTDSDPHKRDRSSVCIVSRSMKAVFIEILARLIDCSSCQRFSNSLCHCNIKELN
jgi:hypothetical protein